jgi:hypothetical protein
MTATMALYWIDVLQAISIVCLIAWLLTFFLSIMMSSDGSAEGKGCWIFFLVVSLIFGATGVFIPSKNTMYMMLATHYAGQSQLPEKVLKAIEVKLDEIIGEKE